MPQKTSAAAINLIRRRSRALQLRTTGATYDAVARVIATEFKLPKYDRARAFQDVDFALGEISRDYKHAAEALRTQDLEILNRLQMAFWEKAMGGDPKSGATLIKILERRARLLGTDAPVQIRVEDEVNKELQTFMDGLEKMLPQAIYEQVLDVTTQLGANANAK